MADNTLSIYFSINPLHNLVAMEITVVCTAFVINKSNTFTTDLWQQFVEHTETRHQSYTWWFEFILIPTNVKHMFTLANGGSFGSSF